MVSQAVGKISSSQGIAPMNPTKKTGLNVIWPNVLCGWTCENNHPSVYYGEIASGNWVMADPKCGIILRDSHDIRCFETEAAGLMNHFPCLVIRGICHYCDDYKNDIWQPYAAAMAAAYAKDLLRIIKPLDVENRRVVPEVLGDIRQDLDGLKASVKRGK
ncbi:hypothetical protein BDW59DRAFT_62607 [Aspergillus cavernicola]|uniref:Nucleoside phosphorylase domain-containing protein n=1 Tax=Aspergillus cavernicola TaxID=176166 RepID=A0ABR4IFT5_9EURO